MKGLQLGFIGMFVLLSAGCATVGYSFNYQNRSQLHIGTTTYAQALAFLGTPRLSNVTDAASETKILQYMYATGSLFGATSRVLLLEFRNDVLNAYVYNSSFPGDSTDFPFSSTANIQPGRSTRSYVKSLLGEPSGGGVCPCELFARASDLAGTEVWIWVFTPPTRALARKVIVSKQVVITFDACGTVARVESSGGQ